MKEELSRKEVTREIWNGFDVCLKYRVELGSKVWKNVRKTHILGIFGSPVPVHFGFWSFLANVYRYTLGVYRYT